VLVSEFDYHLPEDLIAQEPLADRAASRMLHMLRDARRFEDRQFREFPNLLHPDDLVVFNNTRVFPARLFGHRSGTHSQPVSPRNPAARDFLKGKVEVLLTSPASQSPEPEAQSLVWNALVRPGRKIGVGELLTFGDELRAEVIARGEFGERTLRFEPVPDFFAAVERIGHVPLPPYIGREDRPEDRERYQTVYARQRGSVAAPTAGLHFTPEILERMVARKIETAEITLHVGLGTFQPVHAEVVEEHTLHREWYSIGEAAAEKINAAKQAGRRVVAVGTTTVRTLEYAAYVAAAEGGRRHAENAGAAALGYRTIQAGSGEAGIFIYPGFQFRVVGALLTNFHLPKSTLLMLVCAFAGREFTLEAYRQAVEQRYRFYSYGDCMFIE
jgi:S-adenosylmethionine:tRNA ribosyltransferase-isomerase